MTDLDEALRARADRWAREQGGPPPLTAALARIPLRRNNIRIQLAVAAVLLGVLAVVVPLIEHKATPAVPQSTRDRLSTIALRVAEDNGDPNPTSVQAVRHGDWRVQLTGRFVCRQCKIPAGAATPTGSVISLRVDPHTYDVPGFGIGTARQELAKLGTVLDLPDHWPAPAALWSIVRDDAVPGNAFTARAVYTTRTSADRVLEDAPDHRDGMVWVVAAAGRFHALGACCARGQLSDAPSPHPVSSARLTLVFRARDGVLIDSGPTEVIASDSTPDLASLGHVVTLHG